MMNDKALKCNYFSVRPTKGFILNELEILQLMYQAARDSNLINMMIRLHTCFLNLYVSIPASSLI